MKSRRMLLAAAIALAAPIALFVISCKGVLDIPERKYDSTLDPEAAPGCADYCAAALSGCTATASLYASVDTCTKTCAVLAPGKNGDTTGNTIGCRKYQAEAAQMTGETADTCPAAGPGGDGKCGSNCESYCELLKAICPTQYATLDDCPAACAKVPDKGGFHEPTPDENSIQCRLFHLTSATLLPEHHCPHAIGLAVCVDQPDGGADGG